MNTRARIYYSPLNTTEFEDENLRDPAVRTRNYQEVAAARLKISTIWGYQFEGLFPRFSKGEFYPIHNNENGVLIQHTRPPRAKIITTALARYDRKANGYMVTMLLRL